MEEIEVPERKSIMEYRNRKDWTKWKDTINKELNSVTQRKVFGSKVHTPNEEISMGHK